MQRFVFFALTLVFMMAAAAMLRAQAMCGSCGGEDKVAAAPTSAPAVDPEANDTKFHSSGMECHSCCGDDPGMIAANPATAPSTQPTAQASAKK